MGTVEVRFGHGDKRRTLGWLYVSADGFLRYFKHEIVEERGHVKIVKRGWLGRDIQWTEYHV